MLDAAPAVFIALEGSGLGQAIRQSSWIYMAANVGHIVALVVFAGAVAVLDLRMARRVRRDRAGPRARPARGASSCSAFARRSCSPARCCSPRRRAT